MSFDKNIPIALKQRMREESRVTTYQSIVKDNSQVESVASWNAKGAAVQRGADPRTAKVVAAQLHQKHSMEKAASQHLRRLKLQALYQAEHQEFVAELGQHGLTLAPT
eukprot:ANDGO_07012.mRNA.1 hypothetical protein